MLVVPALFLHVERRREVEDLLAMLDRDDPPRGKAAPVAGAVDLIDHRDRRVTGTDEIGMQRMAHPVRHRAIGGHQSLRDNMAAKDARGGFPARPDAAEQVDLKLFDIQQFKELAGHIGHLGSVLLGRTRIGVGDIKIKAVRIGH